LAAGVIVDWEPALILPAVIGKEQRVRGVFKQLVENAIEAMTIKGWRQRELRIVTSQPEEDLVNVVIEDSGPGIPEADRFKVFEPFYTGKGKKSRKAGLGLSMVQDVITELKGTIDIAGAAKGGCRIELKLPLSERGGEEA
jgi:C4-dicarboxylate-specific signal transduction histidine kinase